MQKEVTLFMWNISNGVAFKNSTDYSCFFFFFYLPLGSDVGFTLSRLRIHHHHQSFVPQLKLGCLDESYLICLYYKRKKEKKKVNSAGIEAILRLERCNDSFYCYDWLFFFRYAGLRRHLLVDPHVPKDGSSSPNIVMDNPLSQNPGVLSILRWNLKFDFSSFW